MNFPAELTEFVIEKVGYNDGFEVHNLGSLRSWELNIDEFGNSVEIRNAPLFSRQAKSAIALMALYMTIFCLIFTAATVFLSQDIAIRILFIPVAWGLGIFTTIIVAAGVIHKISASASPWKGGLRFRYDRSSREIFFPRENTRYAHDDYDTLILGMTDGYDSVKMVKNTEDDRDYFTAFTQTYFLVCKKDGTWIRHLIGYDYPSKSTYRAIEEIQKAMQCPMVKRTMSLQECYATQHKISDAGLESEPPPKQKGLVFIYGCLSLFMLIGLGFVGFGIHRLLHAQDEAIGMIIFGIAWLLFNLIFMLLYLHSTRQNDLSAPYTPSEAVLVLSPEK